MLEKYAKLLINYCLDIREGDRLFIQTTTLAEPLVREVYKEALRAGAAVVETDFMFREQKRLLLELGNEAQLRAVSPFYSLAMREFDAYLHIRAPFNLREDANIDASKNDIRQEANADISRIYAQRTASKALRRTLCQYPTDAAAQEANMSLSEYETFVFNACKLNQPDPTAAWLAVRKMQQGIVDHLNTCTSIHYVSEKMNIRFSTKGRTWINSDGQNNMPSGEVYTSPVENSVNGVAYFSFPSIHGGHEVQEATLWVKDGYIEKWEATRGKEYLDKIFNIKGARRFGEAAIGTNYDIPQLTKNILFDEKIGGTIHMAIGQSYLQAGGKNESSIHWDMINDMRQGGEIYADDVLIYRNGLFLI